MTVIDLVRWLGETSLAVSVLILLVLLVRKPIARAFGARAAYALWLAPAIRLFLPELKLLPAPDAAPAAAAVEQVHIVLENSAALAAAAPGFDWASLAAAVALILWATIAFAWFSLRLEAQSRYLRAQMANSEPAPAEIAELGRAIARQLGVLRTPHLRVRKDDDAGPSIIGLFRPVIFLPAGFERDYARAEQRLALAHEIAHVARGDMAATLAASALQALQWPNPLAHLSFRAFRTDQEAACDAYVLARCAKGNEAAGDYAAAIVKSVRAGSNTPAYGLALAHPVKERLMLLKSPKKGRARLLAGAAIAAAFTATSLAATASYGFADEKPAKKEERIVEKKQKKVWVVSSDGKEALQADGVKGASKVEINEENGNRTVRIYDKDGALLTENVYGPDAELPFKTIKFKDKDGNEKEFDLTQTLDGGEFVFVGKGDFDVAGLPKDGKKRVMAFTTAGGPGEIPPLRFDMAACEGEDEGDTMMFEWRDETGAETNRIISRDVLCLDVEADPEKRAEALRKMITLMEDNAKKDAERRKEHIAKMKEELKKAEQEAKKK